ncbi:sialate O-acetylesterase-like [Branchiostoma floridae]|uniref:Sialate O-acetylesterase-like n=1 Tax=Branchiostoma floridae TaxID=7739 RepID=A0A9J7LBE6_BRAFL|nr:sialate O-acetylesterase-like [Branchiostoma floridae]
MVLQREPSRAVIWGYGDVGANVTVSVYPSEKGKVYQSIVQTGPAGKGVWKVTLDAMPAGGPHTVEAVQTAAGQRLSLVLKDVLFGDVWLCSGQSNMVFTMKYTTNASAEIARAADYPHIRLFTADLVRSDSPLYDLQSILQPWAVASPAKANTRVQNKLNKTPSVPESISGPSNATFNRGYFSAVCWFFGRDLYDNITVPIGLVVSAYGGTCVEAWSPPEVIKTCNITSDINRVDKAINKPPASHLGIGEDSWEADVIDITNHPRLHNSALWNAMIHPILNMTLKGVIWYQGEANAVYNETDVYGCLFTNMISTWRSGFHLGSGRQTESVFPFGFVQLSVSSTEDFPELRWSQTNGYGSAPNPDMPRVFMAVAMDLERSHAAGVHPRDKQDVGSRLLLGARAVAYGEDVVFQGPLPTAVKVSSSANTMDVLYNMTMGGTLRLEVRNPDGFEICCSSQENSCEPTSSTWMPAKIIGHTESTVTVSTSTCAKHVTSWRYEWAPTPCLFKQCAIYCQETQLPAPPFKGKVS